MEECQSLLRESQQETRLKQKDLESCDLNLLSLTMIHNDLKGKVQNLEAADKKSLEKTSRELDEVRISWDPFLSFPSRLDPNDLHVGDTVSSSFLLTTQSSFHNAQETGNCRER